MRISIFMGRLRGWTCAVLVAGAWAGASGQTVKPLNLVDPFEGVNRGIYAFNEVLDHAVMRPVAIAYTEIMPRWLRNSVTHFFGNLADVWSIPTNALSLRPKATVDSIKRVAINSTVGLLGLRDVASTLDIDKHPADFGLMLNRWGVPSGPFVVVPLLGPRTLIEVVVYPLDWKGNLANQVDDVVLRDALMAVSFVDARVSYLQADDVVNAVAFDQYSFKRDAYLQRRAYLQNDGVSPDSMDDQP
jgi:phospholipid-binding lipoprotein MlaA